MTGTPDLRPFPVCILLLQRTPMIYDSRETTFCKLHLKKFRNLSQLASLGDLMHCWLQPSSGCHGSMAHLDPCQVIILPICSLLSLVETAMGQLIFWPSNICRYSNSYYCIVESASVNSTKLLKAPAPRNVELPEGVANPFRVF